MLLGAYVPLNFTAVLSGTLTLAGLRIVFYAPSYAGASTDGVQALQSVVSFVAATEQPHDSYYDNYAPHFPSIPRSRITIHAIPA